MNDWISVEDRLPGFKVRDCVYLFDNGNKRLYDASKVSPCGEFKFNDKESFVTHWLEVIPPKQ